MKITYDDVTPWLVNYNEPNQKEQEKNKVTLNSFFSFMVARVSQLYPLVSDDPGSHFADQNDFLAQLNETSRHKVIQAYKHTTSEQS